MSEEISQNLKLNFFLKHSVNKESIKSVNVFNVGFLTCLTFPPFYTSVKSFKRRFANCNTTKMHFASTHAFISHPHVSPLTQTQIDLSIPDAKVPRNNPRYENYTKSKTQLHTLQRPRTWNPHLRKKMFLATVSLYHHKNKAVCHCIVFRDSKIPTNRKKCLNITASVAEIHCAGG